MKLDVLETLNVFLETVDVPQSVIDLSFQTSIVNAGQVIIRQGEPQLFGYLIHEGILRAAHYSHDGKDICKEYYFKGELSFLYVPWIMSQHANYQIEALTDATLIKIPLTKLDDNDWQQAKIKLLQRQLLYKEAKEAFFLLHSPEQRYRYMFEHFPHWIENLNNKQLAIYIGISPISLSRIKSRLS